MKKHRICFTFSLLLNKQSVFLFCIIAALCVSLVLSEKTNAASSLLDLSFGNRGIVTTTGNNGEGNAMAIQSDGKIIMVGSALNGQTYIDFELIRYNSNGSPDLSFGTNGKVLTAISNSSDAANAVAIQPDGKIVAVGNGYNGTDSDFAIARYNQDGSLDLTFDNDGKTLTQVGKSQDIALSVVIQPDGKIVVAGYTILTSNDLNFALARYNTNGTLDDSFGSRGRVTTNFIEMDVAYSVAIQPDGKIVVAGSAYNASTAKIALARYKTDGSLDEGFGTNGKVVSSFADRDFAYAMTIQSDGKIVVAGSSWIGTNSDFTLLRYKTEGSLDSSFGMDGRATSMGIGKWANAVALQPDGKIVAAGVAINGNYYDFALARYNPNGTLDKTFDIDGKVITSAGIRNDYARSVAIQKDGKIVAAGWADVGVGAEFALVRYHPMDAANADFDGDGRTDISIFRPSDGQWWLNQSSDNNVKTYHFGTDSDKIVPGDYDGDNKTDIAYWRPSTGEWLILRSSNFTFYSALFGISTDIPYPGTFDNDNKLDLAVFRPSEGKWYIDRTWGGLLVVEFGMNGDIPQLSDYDGDGVSDICLFRPGDGSWWVQQSTNGFFAAIFGTSNDKPVPADYTGDGRTDIAFWRPATGEWFVLRSEDLSFYAAPFGKNGDIPTPGDYDEDGKADFAVFRPSSGKWFVLKSSGGLINKDFGLTGDVPAPSAYVP